MFVSISVQKSEWPALFSKVFAGRGKQVSYAHRSFWEHLIRAAFFACLVGCVLLIAGRWWLPAVGHWLAQPVRLHQADALVVLGGSLDRATHGIDLMQDGRADEFWHTGYTGPPTANAEASVAVAAAQRAVEQGIAADKVYLLPTTSTWEDGREVAAFVRQRNVSSIIVVTNWYHSRRALCVLQHHLHGRDITVYYSAPTDPAYGPDNWWQDEATRWDVVGELFKIGFYTIRYGVISWQC
jgi:uncharacterized SAM-binding protein YcdF (DUF218 family)